MARRKRNQKSTDPRSNYGKYSSADAPSKSPSASKVSNGNKDVSKGESKESNPREPEASNPVGGDGQTPTRTGSVCNDPEWYAKDTQLVIDAASLPFAEPLGDEVMLQTSADVYNSGSSGPQLVAATVPKGKSVPGIMTVVTKPSYGNNRYAQDPANVAMNALYSHVRYVNSGRKNYDAVDLFMYVTSMADVYSYIMWVERVYAKAYLYSQRNKYVGAALLESEYIDKDDVVDKLANFRYWINAYINKVSSYAVPAEIAYFKRRAWVYSHIYLENPDGNIKDQLYQFAPDGFYRFELDTSGAGMLKYCVLANIVGHAVDSNTLLTVADLEAIGNWLIENITGDEDFGLMSGDILKAFNGNIIGVAPLPEEVDIVPVYSEYVLLQMRNATVIKVSRDALSPLHYDNTGSGVSCYCGNMYQNTDGNLWSMEGVPYDFNVNTRIDSVATKVQKVLTVKTPTPTPIDVMEISRMTLSDRGVYAASGMDPVIRVACGSDIVVEARMTMYDRDPLTGKWRIATPFVVDVSMNTWTSIAGTLLNSVIQYLRFKYAPLYYACDLNTSNTPFVIDNVEVISDVDNYTIVDNRIIERLHEVALLSMLWVPGVAKMVNF